MGNKKIQRISLLIEEQKINKKITNRMIGEKLKITEQAVSKSLKKIKEGKNCGVELLISLAEAVGLEEIRI